MSVVRTWIRVSPGSARPGVGGAYPRTGEPALRVAVRERAVDGRASRAAITQLADALRVSVRDISLDVGARSRDKLVSIETDDPDVVRERLDILRTKSQEPDVSGGPSRSV